MLKACKNIAPIFKICSTVSDERLNCRGCKSGKLGVREITQNKMEMTKNN